MKLTRESLKQIIKEELEEMMDGSEKNTPVTIPRGIVQMYINILNSSLSYLDAEMLDKAKSRIEIVLAELKKDYEK